MLVSLLALGLLVLNFRTQAKYANVKPLVVRIDDVGRAEAVAYDAATYQPQAPELRYFLTQFVVKHFSRLARHRSSGTIRTRCSSSTPRWPTPRSRRTSRAASSKRS